jgi:hypothetical protein
MRRFILTSLATALAVAASAVVVNPQTFTIVRGQVVSGNLSSVFASDDNSLVVRKGPTVAGYEAPLDIMLTAVCSTPNPQRLILNYETRANVAGLTQYVQMWEWSSGSWVELDRLALTMTDAQRQVDIPLCWRFAKPVTGEMRLRFWVANQGPVGASQWAIAIDQMTWEVDP